LIKKEKVRVKVATKTEIPKARKKQLIRTDACKRLVELRATCRE